MEQNKDEEHLKPDRILKWTNMKDKLTSNPLVNRMEFANAVWGCCSTSI